MVIQNLKRVITTNGSLVNKDFVRNLLKEELQVFVLNFIYTSTYKDLVFTGGTCLRKFYGLPRISEDLDFDILDAKFDFDKFQKDLSEYFVQDLQYRDLDLKFKNQTIFLKFSVLKEIGFSTASNSDVLFLRLDFSFNKDRNFSTETQLFSAYDFSFLAKTYDLSTLFANKISALLTREYKRGGEQTESFKGRDVFDLIWMLGEAKKTGSKVNLQRINGLLGIKDKEELRKKILEKMSKVDSRDLYNDLKSFFKDTNFVDNFCQNFMKLLEANIKYL
ncbi:MAG: nucleotidyl transferase AbiEii/AbiGii toxin family protein [Patescibacteria group bacterium]